MSAVQVYDETSTDVEDRIRKEGAIDLDLPDAAVLAGARPPNDLERHFGDHIAAISREDKAVGGKEGERASSPGTALDRVGLDWTP